MKIALRLAFLLVLVVPAVAWFVVKPVRVLVPEAVGMVIGPRAWKAYYVQHELIHHLQGQRFGVLRRLFMPSWLIEGMAYALSQDPRPTLAEPWQAYRTHFTDWLARIGPERMWQEAAGL